jgi:hypothetical protein
MASPEAELLMARSRNYAAEYARRIQKGRTRGLSTRQARGHPGTGESHVSSRAATPRYNPRLEEGLKGLRDGKSLKASARSAHVAPERLRAYIAQTGVVEKEHRRWVVKVDDRLRVVPIFSKGQNIEIRVRGYEPAREAGAYMAAVKQFLATNDRSLLGPFEGQSVLDVTGKRHPFETRPNVLYRLHAAGTEPYEQIYRIVA